MTDSPNQQAAAKVLDDPPTLNVYDTYFDPNPITVIENETVTIIWKGSESSARVITTTQDTEPRQVPIFGGSGSYEIDSSGTTLPVDGLEGDYWIYLGQIGGTVRGTVNVRKRTEG